MRYLYLILALVVAMPPCSPAEIPLLIAPYQKNFELDGDFYEWSFSTFTTVTPSSGVFDKEVSATADPEDLSFRFAVAHDGYALYIAVEVKDDVLVTDSTVPSGKHEPAWDDDAIEVFIDGNFNRAPDARIATGAELRFGGEFSLVANGAATSRFSGFAKTHGNPRFWQGIAKQVDAHTVRYEYRLAWRVMGGRVRPGDTIGFTVAAQDDDDGAGRDHSLYWKAVPHHGWENEAGWGAIYLSKQR